MSEKSEQRLDRIESILERLAAGEEKHRADIAALTANVDRLTAGEEKNRADIAALTANVDRLTVNSDKQHSDIATLTANVEKHSGDIAAMFTVVNRFEESHKQFLKSQVLMADLMAKMEMRHDRIQSNIESISANVDQIAVHMRAITIKHGETEDKLNALIHMFDEWVREHGGRRNGETPKG